MNGERIKFIDVSCTPRLSYWPRDSWECARMVDFAVESCRPPVDGNADDMALLRRYIELGSEDAFAQIVRKHLPWIHATCRKSLGDRHTAEDAAQAVFIILARRAS